MQYLARRSTRRPVHVAVTEVATVQQLHDALQDTRRSLRGIWLAMALICSSWLSVKAIEARTRRERHQFSAPQSKRPGLRVRDGKLVRAPN